jgi:hypothetical protein
MPPQEEHSLLNGAYEFLRVSANGCLPSGEGMSGLASHIGAAAASVNAARIMTHTQIMIASDRISLTRGELV